MKTSFPRKTRSSPPKRRASLLPLLLTALACLLCACTSMAVRQNEEALQEPTAELERERMASAAATVPPESAPIGSLPSEASASGTEATADSAGAASGLPEPEATEAPAPTESPKPTEAPKSTEAPKPTEAPKSTEAPKPTEAPKSTEAPKPTEAPKSSEPEPPGTPFSYHGLVELLRIDNSFVIDQRYATADNFTGIQQYDRELCLVQEDIVDMLIAANELAKQHGLRLKIWDAYRPISVQQALHDSAPEELAPYVPAPSPYSMHARGITVDLTLCYPDGSELDMPTAFDDFSTAANSDYDGATPEQIANRELLNEIMSAAGFKRSRLEWWHFDGPNRDHYEILDVSFAEFEAARDA